MKTKWETILLNPLLKLENSRAIITPLEESHLKYLTKVGSDPRIWTYNYRFDCRNEEDMKAYIVRALRYKESFERIPFVVFDKVTQQIAGSVSLYGMEEDFGTIGFGYIWFHPDYWRTGLNLAVYSAIYDFCFQELSCRRLEFHVNSENIISRKACEKYGAVFEGILGSLAVFRDTGKEVDMVSYSLLRKEYEAIRPKIHVQ